MTAASPHDSAPLLEVSGLRVWFPKGHDMLGRPRGWIKAVDDVTFVVRRGETLALVGESGSGKTTTCLAVLRALTPTAGRVLFRPDDGNAAVDLATLKSTQVRPYRRYMQMVFQDPFSSLNPRMTVLQLIAEPLVVNRIGTAAERRQRVQDLLAEVGLDRQYINRYPHAFSGGQRQRLVVARALALQPSLIVCDEPVSALDVSVQAQTLNLMMSLKERYNLAYLFIAHDLEVVRHIADRVAVMYAGRLVEDGTRDQVFARPLHPYTQSLLESSPRPDPSRRGARSLLRGEVPDPSNLPSGCVFHPRCPKARPECSTRVPAVTVRDDQTVRCLLYEN